MLGFMIIRVLLSSLIGHLSEVNIRCFDTFNEGAVVVFDFSLVNFDVVVTGAEFGSGVEGPASNEGE